MMWRFNARAQLRPGYPAPFKQMFMGLPEHVRKVDAVYERPGDNHILFFTGKLLLNFSKKLSDDFFNQVDNIGFLMAPAFLRHKTFLLLVYQVLWTNWMMYLFGVKTEKLTSSIRICIGGSVQRTNLWTRGILKILFEIGEEFREILMQH